MKYCHWGQLATSYHSHHSKLCYHKVKTENLNLKFGNWQWGLQLSILNPSFGESCDFVSFMTPKFWGKGSSHSSFGKAFFVIPLWPRAGCIRVLGWGWGAGGLVKLRQLGSTQFQMQEVYSRFLDSASLPSFHVLLLLVWGYRLTVTSLTYKLVSHLCNCKPKMCFLGRT